ncbi:TlpA disulfide reductase family protein [Actinosynnema sp. NPDC023587]|uniref:TlpA family protein disulfide reductase n=1 Tax=Actinosynnema sp. NPDC023587 TaxID=3154695 RepID=UPI00340849E0
MSRGARWAAVVLVLAVAGVVALWPRTPDPEPSGSGPPPGRPAQDLGPLRERAALRPCPAGPAGQAGASGATGQGGPAVLRGVTARCLGDGSEVDAATALSGPAVVNFWATWCLPCQGELRVLDAYAREPGAVPVVTVLVESKEGDGLELLAKLGVRLPAVFSGEDAVREAVRPRPGMPVTFVVGADGALTEVTRYPVLTSVEQVREVVG